MMREKNRRLISPLGWQQRAFALGLCAMVIWLGAGVGLIQYAHADGRYWSDPTTGFALGGYDVVSYWSSSGPVLGSEEYEVRWENVTWRFSNRGNCEEFLKHADLYAPLFSGYGAYAVSQGKAPRGNPEIWTIADNKLYFFYSLDAKTKWGLARKKFIREAMKYWPKLKRKIAYSS